MDATMSHTHDDINSIAYSEVSSINFENIPQELKELNQWVLWKYQEKDGKRVKVPFAVSGYKADTTDETTWASFAATKEKYLDSSYDGIGFVFSKNDPYLGIDLDKVVDKGGVVKPFAAKFIQDVNSYTEKSPSGTGVHVFVRGNLDGLQGNKKSDVEMYDKNRFFTVTGNVYGVFPKAINHDSYYAREFHREVFGKREATTSAADFNYVASYEPLDGFDKVLLEQMFGQKNGETIKRMYNGDWHEFYSSQSEADLALVSHLAWFDDYRDTSWVDKVFRHSGLYRDKWDRAARSGETYGEGTVRKAFADKNPGDGYSAKRADTQATSSTAEGKKVSGRQFKKWHGSNKEKIKPHKMLLNYPYNIPLGMVSSIYSLPGVGKSTVASYLAVTTALGLPFLGTPQEAGNVLYLDFETDENFLVPRVNEVARGLELNPDVLDGKLFYYSFEGEGVFIPDVLGDVMLWAQVYNPRLILIDAYQRAFGKNPNDAEQVTKQMGYLTTLAVQSGAAVVFLDHTSKPQKDHISDTMFGSQYKNSFSRSAHKLTVTDNPDVLEWRTTKTNMRKGDPVGIRVEHGNEFDDNDKTVRFSKADVVYKDASTKDHVRRVVSNYLEDNRGKEIPLTQLIDVAVKEAGVSEQHARNVVTEWLEPIIKTGGIKEIVGKGRGKPKSYLWPELKWE